MILPEIKYSKSFIIAMSEYSGTGKSTFAKIFSNQLSCYILGGDKIQEITEYVFKKELIY